MRRGFIQREPMAIACLVVVVTVATLHAQDLDARLAEAYRQAAATLQPSIVRIETAGGAQQIDGVRTGAGPFTGLVVSPDGWIVSSAFALAKRPTGILVETKSGQKIPARIVGTDHSRMISLLKVDAGSFTTPSPVPRLEIQPGQTAIALGRTWTDGPPTISVGIISATRRVWGKAIQTDAKVSPANYGGPLVDLQGRVYGILVPLDPVGRSPVAGFEWYDSGIGFAIPLVDILDSLPKLQEGDLFPGLAGIQFRPGDPFQPPVIQQLRWRSPAALAGIRPGDIIKLADGQPVERLNDVRQVLGNKYADQSIRLSVQRAGHQQEATLQLVAELPAYRWPFLGCFAETNEGKLRITEVIDGSPAHKAELASDDILESINEQPVSTPQEARAILDQLAVGETATLSIQRAEKAEQKSIQVSPLPNELPQIKSPAPEGPNEPILHDQKIGPSTFQVYVPQESESPALLIYLAGENAPPAELLAKAWKPHCEEQNIVFLVLEPRMKGRWRPQDLPRATQSIRQATKHFQADPERIIVHGVNATAPPAQALAAANRTMIRGVLLVGSASAIPRPTDPSEKQAFAWLYDRRDLRRTQIQATQRAMSDAGYPVASLETELTDRQYLTPNDLARIALWTRWLAAL